MSPLGVCSFTMEINPMESLSIYVACLASYNNGILFGRWISANQSVDEIMEQIYAMLDDSPIKDAEEWAIHDYSGFGDIRLSEYESIETIVEYAEFIDEQGELAIAVIAEYGFDDAKQMIEDRYQGCYDSKVDFAQSLIDECYSETLPDNLMRYFDYEAFARDLFINDYCSVNVSNEVHVFSYN